MRADLPPVVPRLRGHGHASGEAGFAMHASPEFVRAVAEAVADELQARALAVGATPDDDRWLTSAEAADYLGMSVQALHKLTAARALPFAQDGPGARCYFKRSQLDAWRAL